MKVLIVDDELLLIKGLKNSFEQESYEVDLALEGNEALRKVSLNDYDIILLDIILPDLDGLEVCQRIREISNVPLLILTANNEDMNKILSLEYGADDYVTKPFQPLELVARVKAQLRRVTKYNNVASEESEEGVIAFSGLVLNKNTHECILNEEQINLTPTEFNLLWILCSNRGVVFSADNLFEEIWGDKYYSNSNNTIMVHIRHIREKMKETADNPKYIKTVWGVGYKVE